MASPEVEHLTPQWHEARAADLLRTERADVDDPSVELDGSWTSTGEGTVYREATPDAVARAAVHVELAKSMRLGEIGKALLEGGRANSNGLRRLADSVKR